MDRNEFKSLPPSFFEEERSAPEPMWLLILGTVCILASVLIAAVLLFRI